MHENIIFRNRNESRHFAYLGGDSSKLFLKVFHHLQLNVDLSEFTDGIFLVRGQLGSRLYALLQRYKLVLREGERERERERVESIVIS